MTDHFKRFMTFSRGERAAIIIIVSMIVIMLIAKYIIISNPPKRDYFKHDLDSIIARRDAVLDSMRRADSLAKEATKANKSPRYARNDRAVISSEARAFARGEKISKISPLPAVGRNDVIVDLNTADTTALKQLPGIGSAFAKWIVDYRAKLGGYCETEQLMEVYRMDTARFDGIKDFVKVDSSYIPKTLKINSDSFKVLVRHPYLQYEDVKKIVNHREQKGMIASWEQLVKVVGDAINPRLRYYVEYR